MNPGQLQPFPAASSATTATGRQHSVSGERKSSGAHLEVGSHLSHRRSSLDSTYSELSELSFLSNEFRTNALARRASDVSDASHYSSASRTLKPSWRQKMYDLYDQNYGALLVLLSQAFGSGMNIATRILEQPGPHGEPMHPFQILFTRQSLTALFCTTYALGTGSIPHFPLGPPDRKVRLLLVCRGLFGFFGVFGMYFSLLYLPLSEATVLTFLAPILTCYLCTFVIPGETFSRQQQIAGFVSLLGVIFIAQPVSLFTSNSNPATSTSTGAEPGFPNHGFEPGSDNSPSQPAGHHFSPVQPTPSEHLLAIGIAMVGVCGATGAMTAIRAIGTRAHAFISINYFSVWSSFVSMVALIVLPTVSFRFPGNLTEWCLLLSLGICGFIMQGLLTMGLAYKSTGRGGGSGQPKPRRSRKSNTIDEDPEDIEMQSDIASSSDRRQQNSERRMKAGRQKKQSQPARPSSSGTKATSMVYTQMLFALAGDRVVFGVTPGVWSWIGSGLILTGAIWVASARDGGKETSKKSHSFNSTRTIDRETGMAFAGKNKNEENVGLLDDDAHDIHDSDERDDDDNNDDSGLLQRDRSETVREPASVLQSDDEHSVSAKLDGSGR